MNGTLEVLSVGHGHLTINITEGNEEEIEKARRIITDMLRRGYEIFVEHSHPNKPGRKVKEFDPSTMTYFVDDSPAVEEMRDTAVAAAVTAGGGTPPPPKSSKRKGRPVKATSAKAVVVGRTAGG